MKRIKRDDFGADFDMSAPNLGYDMDFGMDFGDDEQPQIVATKPKEKAAEVITETAQAFRDRHKVEAARFEKATDSEYWVCVCFQSRAEKESFLKAAKLFEMGDKYLDGWNVAKTLNIPFNRDTTGYGKLKIDPRLVDFVD